MRGHQIMLVFVSYIRLLYKIIPLQQFFFFLMLDLTVACTALFTNAHMPLFLLCSHLENVNLLHYK